MARCPVCDTEYVEGQNKYCSECGWDLTINLQIIVTSQQILNSVKNVFETVKAKKIPPQASHSHELQKNPQELEEAKKRILKLECELEKVIKEQNNLKIKLEKIDNNPVQNFLSKLSEYKNVLTKTIKRVYDLEQSELKRNDILQQIKVQLDNTQNTSVAEREELNTWKQEIEVKIENIEKSQLLIDSPAQPSLVPQIRETQTQSETQSEDINLTYDENYIVRTYQNYPSNLPPTDATEVNATEDSINDNRLGVPKVLLTKIQRGNYWIIKQGGFAYLVPRKNLKINEHSYKTAEALFECRGYQAGYSRNFQLLKPARVSESSEGEKWQLEEKGVLAFY